MVPDTENSMPGRCHTPIGTWRAAFEQAQWQCQHLLKNPAKRSAIVLTAQVTTKAAESREHTAYPADTAPKPAFHCSVLTGR